MSSGPLQARHSGRAWAALCHPTCPASQRISAADPQPTTRLRWQHCALRSTAGAAGPPRKPPAAAWRAPTPAQPAQGQRKVSNQMLETANSGTHEHLQLWVSLCGRQIAQHSIHARTAPPVQAPEQRPLASAARCRRSAGVPAPPPAAAKPTSCRGSGPRREDARMYVAGGIPWHI